MIPHCLDNLPGPKETVSGNIRTVVSYRVDEGKIMKVSACKITRSLIRQSCDNQVTQVYEEVRQQVPRAIAKRRVRLFVVVYKLMLWLLLIDCIYRIAPNFRGAQFSRIV